MAWVVGGKGGGRAAPFDPAPSPIPTHSSDRSQFNDGNSYVKADYQIQCNDNPAYSAQVVFVIIMILVCE